MARFLGWLLYSRRKKEEGRRKKRSTAWVRSINHVLIVSIAFYHFREI
ncbi:MULTISPECIES: hypothetical protein [unclassified Microcoleus]